MRLCVAIAFSLLVLGAPTARAQFNVGLENNGQINVEVTATLPDGPNGSYPGAYQPLTLYRNATDSMQLAFDGAGVLRFAIAPGTYRIASVARWQGREYRWNMALPVVSGMRTVALTAANASITNAAPSRVAREDATALAAPGEPYDRKSGTVATLLSLLVTGGGQMYAGRVNKGIGLLALGLAGGVVTAVSLNEYNKNDYPGVDNSAGTAGIITGVSISLGTYIYSIATANHDVHQYNLERHAIGDASPILRQRDGRTSVGLAFKL